MAVQQETEWFSTWFDSPYYHILYKDRDMQEARHFIHNLLVHLHPKPHEKILDLACGKGRHSLYLSQQGFEVTGIDLSRQSINYARQFANERLHFDVHDMRHVYRQEEFDFILNLFTSFGYFETDTENIVALCATAESLKHGGKLVIDFMNTDKVIDHLVAHEEKEVQGINFKITRGVENGFIIKTIDFEDAGEHYHFEERVRALRQEDFLEYFKMTQLRLVETFGDYDLNPYNQATSDRMVFVLKK
ncbi:SAM-dependent methyltransferase [Pontibacter akesuensis]|uniref:Methyltransferase domain-containing protein n=1 Tax=Pontibacter akesuensis TaxID=388950 RepID=A0A1I7I4M8_9BACT|nr:class I SAM-dependent methyltransferase [Pontibacter akesuensis]GHA65195.1 methyltransferase [Pontibacter akesuensis]SFU67854.1 Methyltransferase domain-containing protein [Pontibacter akesuensis]